MENAVERWLRCNKCYRSAKKTARTFVLTQCQHVFCGKCRDGVEKSCPECQTRDVRTVSLVKPLPEQLAHYFARVGISVQQSFEASRFQRTQMSIVIRRLDVIVYKTLHYRPRRIKNDIPEAEVLHLLPVDLRVVVQDGGRGVATDAGEFFQQQRYEEMKRTYYEGATHMKSLLAAYEQEKEKNARLANELAQLRSMASQIARPTTATSSFAQQDRRTLDYVKASAQSRDDNARSSCAPGPPLARQVAPGAPSRHPRSKENPPNRHPRSKIDPEYRFRMPQTDVLQYPKRAIPSYMPAAPAPGDSRHMDAGWNGRNRVASSLGSSSEFSSDAGTMRR